MKKLSKTLLAIAAVSAASMAMTASAMAMTADYADGTVTLSDVTATGASQTLLIVNEAGVTVDSSNASDVVEQIDQKDDGTSFASVPVGTLADGTYEVRIGGTDGSMQKTTFTVGDEVEPGTITIKIGDANMDGRVSGLDASAIAKDLIDIDDADTANVKKEYNVVSGIDATTFVIGDATLDGRVSGLDASAVAKDLIDIDDADTANVQTEIQVVEQ